MTEATQNSNGAPDSEAVAASSQASADASAAAANAAAATGEAGDEAAGKATEGQDDSANKSAAPAEYADFKLPDGVTFEAEAIGDIKAFAKELNLTQEQAQLLVDREAARMQSEPERVQAFIADQSKAWAEALKADKEFGGDAFDGNTAAARKAIEQFGSPELKEMLEATGLGNHPDWVKAWAKVGKAISDDGFITGNKGASNPDPAKRMFPSMN